MEVLGHHITAEGAEPLQQKVAAIADFQRPQDAKGMQRFLGMINFTEGLSRELLASSGRSRTRCAANHGGG